MIFGNMYWSVIEEPRYVSDLVTWSCGRNYWDKSTPGRSKVKEEQLMALHTMGTEATSRDLD